jgi:hypothetical protein
VYSADRAGHPERLGSRVDVDRPVGAVLDDQDGRLVLGPGDDADDAQSLRSLVRGLVLHVPRLRHEHRLQLTPTTSGSPVEADSMSAR